MKYLHNLIRTKSAIRRFLAKSLQLHRPASYPYLSGDGYRAIAEHVYDQFFGFAPEEVRERDIVFVRNNLIQDFFATVHPHIEKPYVLISANEDENLPHELEKFIDEKILHWYGQNICFAHPKVTPLPLGIQNHTSGYPQNFIYCINKEHNNRIRKDKILYSFNTKDNRDRQNCEKELSKLRTTEKIDVNQIEYYKILSSYKFIVCPSGRGLDCHRIWEALYNEVAPILLDCPWSQGILDLGFPVILVSKWEDLSIYNEQSLADKYEELRPKFSTPKLFLSYWYNEFSKYRRYE